MKPKDKLDVMIPEHVIFSEHEKERIIKSAKERANSKMILSKRFIMPSFVTVVLLLVIVFFITPFIQQAFFTSHLEPEKVLIPGVEIAYLNNAIYIDSTNEFVYTDHQGIYSFNKQTEVRQTLVQPKKSAEIFDIVVNEKWLAWYDGISHSLNIMNRKSNEKTAITLPYVGDLSVTNDTLIFLFSENQGITSYEKVNLNTMEETTLHVLSGDEGAGSRASVDDGKIVIPEAFKNQYGEFYVTYFVYNIYSNERLAEISVPYEQTINVTLTNNRIYAQLVNFDESSVLGYVDLSDKQLYHLDVPSFWDYAIYENYVALSLPNDESNSVKLFEIIGDEVMPLPTFDGIQGQLVVPRFTEEGTLVVNRKGFTVYLVETK